MKVKLFIALFFSLLILSCNKGDKTDDSCNGSSTRRDIKLVVDSDSLSVDTTVIVASIDSIGAIEVNEADKNTSRQDIEKKVFQVTGKISKLSTHRDGDYKLKFESENEKYLNCEAPNPDCPYAKESRFYEQFKTVYAWIKSNEDEIEDKTLTITGVAFIDIDHKYPRNAAENELELHPILDISF